MKHLNANFRSILTGYFLIVIAESEGSNLLTTLGEAYTKVYSVYKLLTGDET